MQVCVPGTAQEFETLMRQTYNNGSPTYLRTSIQTNKNSQDINFGKLQRVQDGADGVVIAVGPMLDRTLAAVEGLDLTVLYATTVVPFDEETLRDALSHAEANIITIEPYYEGALVHNVAKALKATPTRIEAIGVPRRVLDRYGSADRHDLALGLDEAGIRARIKGFLNKVA